MDFSGKVAIVTGAASGMGLVFSKSFAELGGNVIMCDINGENIMIDGGINALGRWD